MRSHRKTFLSFSFFSFSSLFVDPLARNNLSPIIYCIIAPSSRFTLATGEIESFKQWIDVPSISLSPLTWKNYSVRTFGTDALLLSEMNWQLFRHLRYTGLRFLWISNFVCRLFVKYLVYFQWSKLNYYSCVSQQTIRSTLYLSRKWVRRH